MESVSEGMLAIANELREFKIIVETSQRQFNEHLERSNVNTENILAKIQDTNDRSNVNTENILAKIQDTNDRSNVNIEKILEKMQDANSIAGNRLNLLEDKKSGDMEMVKRLNTTASVYVEEEVNHAIKEYLEDSTILAAGYQWQARDSNTGMRVMGEVDGIIIGRLYNEDVIVFVESKTNMDSKGVYRGAIRQCWKSVGNWRAMRDVSLDDSDIEPGLLKDFITLNVSEHRDRIVKLALGGLIFSVEEKKQIDSDFLFVVSEPAGKFKVIPEKETPEKATGCCFM